jgi:hypothetical protein
VQKGWQAAGRREAWFSTAKIVANLSEPKMEERPAANSGSDYWVRARFGDFITPWIEAWKVSG